MQHGIFTYYFSSRFLKRSFLTSFSRIITRNSSSSRCWNAVASIRLSIPRRIVNRTMENAIELIPKMTITHFNKLFMENSSFMKRNSRRILSCPSEAETLRDGRIEKVEETYSIPSSLGKVVGVVPVIHAIASVSVQRYGSATTIFQEPLLYLPLDFKVALKAEAVQIPCGIVWPVT